MQRMCTTELKERLQAVVEAQGRSTFKAAGPAHYAAVSDCLRDHPVSVERENILREFLGMSLLLVGEAPICPHHGVVHSTVCDHNGPVKEVVALREGQYVAQERIAQERKRKQYWTLRLEPDMKERCAAAGVDPRRAIEEALKQHEAKQ